MTLVSRDVQLLETVAEILEVKARLVPHRGGYAASMAFHITFGDRLFCDWLVGIGITPRKTHTIGAVAVPDSLFTDFLRGHLDGDGSIITYVDRYNTKLKSAYVYQRLYVKFVSASKAHLEWLQACVRRTLGIDGYLTVQRPAQGPRAALYGLCFAKKEAILLLRRIYYAPDLPCLARKRAIAERFLTGELRQFRHPPGFQVREPGCDAASWAAAAL